MDCEHSDSHSIIWNGVCKEFLPPSNAKHSVTLHALGAAYSEKEQQL